MPPRIDKPSNNEKCYNKESGETKSSSLFSFRWLLRRSKSSKSAKEMAQSDKSVRSTAVPQSKSCDSGMAWCKDNNENCSSTFVLWRLLPSKTKSSNFPTCDRRKTSSHAVKSSFSSSDVYNLFPGKNTSIPTIMSSYHVPLGEDVTLGPRTNPSTSSSNNQDILGAHMLPLQSSLYKTAPGNFVPQTCHLVLCKLCLVMVPAAEMHQMDDCGCVFCISCMQQFLTVNIREGNVVITCPDAMCAVQGTIQVSEVEELVDEDVYDMFQRFKLNREVELDPARTWCPGIGCETICHFHPSADPNRGVPAHCHNCGLTFCSSCKLRWHATRTCEELRKAMKDEEEFPLNLSDDDDVAIKRCPNCRIPIERDEGCAQMMCKRCKHVFCWYCLASLDDDFLLRHYDKGPCKNKLGHSRASVVWHRTQVVGIFAGFGFLLLVASPLLLLAAPCLLCCRCKCKFFYEEPTAL